MSLDLRLHKAIRMNLSLLLALTLLAGCVSKVALTKPARESIRSVSINKDIKVPDYMIYLGQAQSVGLAFGCIGGAATASAAERDKDDLKAAMKSNQIDLGQIVREQFASELAESNVFPLIVSEAGDAEVRLEVRSFGFAVSRGFSDQLKPMLDVTGSLVRTNGTVLWQQHDDVSNLNDQTPAHTLWEYMQNPQFIREAFTSAATIVSKNLVKHMLQD